jgi:transposase InsO family protein
MKICYENISINSLCEVFEVSRQAYYQHERSLMEDFFEWGLVLEEVRIIRQRHPRIGVRKLQEMLAPFMREHSIRMGRDAMFDLLSVHGLLVRTRRRSIRTTHSYHWLKKHPNLIVDFVPAKPNELWVSDITHWKLKEKPVFLSLITDAYSRKIVGYHLSETLHADQTTKALKMALSGWKNRSNRLIHHSDRGIQYCSSLYVGCLKKNHIDISMTQNGDPLENAVAERINGIIKDEYLLNYTCKNINNAKKLLTTAVSLYNMERPHSSIGNLTPETVHNQSENIREEKIKRLWKNYYPKKSYLCKPKTGLKNKRKVISGFNY